MDNEQYSSGNDKLEFRQIVLGHIKRILELSSHELRDSTRSVNTGTSTQTIEQEDTRIAYIQSIENLAYVLVPYFDDKIEKSYNECIKIIIAFKFEVKEILEKEYKSICEKVGKENLDNDFVVEMKLRYAKQLFYELNLLLKRCDYLKSAIFGEDTSEEVTEEKGEGEE